MHAISNVTYLVLMDQNGNTALMWAALIGNAAVVTLLLDRGASINVATKVE